MNTFQFVVFKSFNMQEKEIKREKEAQKNVWHKKEKKRKYRNTGRKKHKFQRAGRSVKHSDHHNFDFLERAVTGIYNLFFF